VLRTRDGTQSIRADHPFGIDGDGITICRPTFSLVVIKTDPRRPLEPSRPGTRYRNRGGFWDRPAPCPNVSRAPPAGPLSMPIDDGKSALSLLSSASQGVIGDDASKALDPLQMRDSAVNLGKRLTTRLPNGEQPGDVRTLHVPKTVLALFNN
jgi:hypothetical protein